MYCCVSLLIFERRYMFLFEKTNGTARDPGMGGYTHGGWGLGVATCYATLTVLC